MPNLPPSQRPTTRPPSTGASLGLLGLTFATAWVSGCGGAAPPPAASGAATTVDEASAEVDRAEAEVSALVGGASAPAQQQGVAAPTAQPPGLKGGEAHAAPAEAPRPSPAAGAPENATSTGDEGEPDHQCKSACSALASMLRAVDHLCELTGREDARCLSAKGRSDRARDRVTQSCSECGT